MRIAITGGTGFVGRHLARRLVDSGHSVVLIHRPRPSDSAVPAAMAATRPGDPQDIGTDRRASPRVEHAPVGLADADRLAEAFTGCDAVAHLAGINREIGEQTFVAVHVEGTRNVVEAAKRAGVPSIALLSFLRARPDCGSAYHESKWAAEEIVRGSGLGWSVLKAGVIYGRGDHMLDHLSHALHSFPVFLGVGLRDRPVRPVAVEDVVEVLVAALLEDRLIGRSVAVVGPETMGLREAVRRVMRTVGRSPRFVPAPLWLHRLLAIAFEWTMVEPLAARAQVRILSEGIVEAAGPVDMLPPDLVPRRRFDAEGIRAGLPPAGPFTWRDCRCLARLDQARST